MKLFPWLLEPKDLTYHDLSADEEIERLREDLNEKLIKAKEQLGEKWILHPCHMVEKKNLGTNTLGKML